MISDAIKKQFVDAVMVKTMDEILVKQQKQVLDWNLIKSGDLFSSLYKNYTLTSTDSYSKLTMNYLTYTRFLDMKKKSHKKTKGGFKLYNRIIWGIVYGKMFPKLRYGLSQDIQREIVESIKNSFRQGPYIVKD